MKYVFLAIIVLFSSQPLQAVSCDMHDTQGMTHSQTGDMQQDHGMDMDCCDQEPANPVDNCDSMFNCGSCTAVVTAISPAIVNVGFSPGSLLLAPDPSEPSSRFSSPPFKPPIT